MSDQAIAVLVVEDEFLLRLDIADALEAAGFIVFQAENAHQAIQLLIANDRIRVLFTDVDMPGDLDGLRLAALVRDRWPPIRIILTSGHQWLHEDRLPPGGRFLPKPYHPDRVISSIRELVQA